MEPDLTQQRHEAHALLDMLPVEKLNAVRSLLAVMVDPVSRALATAPIDDEPLTPEEEQAIAEASEWLKHNEGIPLEQVVAELGFTMREVEDCQDSS